MGKGRQVSTEADGHCHFYLVIVLRCLDFAQLNVRRTKEEYYHDCRFHGGVWTTQLMLIALRKES
jgi:hypothetical protein